LQEKGKSHCNLIIMHCLIMVSRKVIFPDVTLLVQRNLASVQQNHPHCQMFFAVKYSRLTIVPQT